MEVIEKKLHPVLKKHTITISYNMRVNCFDAAKVFGSAYFWNAAVEHQEEMIAHVNSRKVIDAIVNYEASELAKKDAKKARKSKQRG